MTKEQLRCIIGENIRNQRMARDISIDELAEMLDLTSGFVGLIERGHRGTTPITLFKLSDVFSLSIDSFFHKKEESSLSMAEEYVSKNQTKRKKIDSLISDFSERELDFVIAMLKYLRIMTRSEDEGEDSIKEEKVDAGDY